MDFDHKKIEEKWNAFWWKNNIYSTKQQTAKRKQQKKYILDMFPYPSGAGLHVGHIEGYTGSDVVARYYRMRGYSVLHPMGWDAFGLPAENFAIKRGVPPMQSTEANIVNFKKYLQASGLSYDWNYEINSSHPDYYRWTQWIFIKFFEAGLAYKKKAPANWCPSCETVLANEQVVGGKCERCDSAVKRKDLDQWFLKITNYADRLIDGLEKIDWPSSTVAMQKNWIGRSEGHKIKFDEIEVFTTRIDTLSSVTFLVLAPNHPILSKLVSKEKVLEIQKFATSVAVQQFEAEKNKQGIFTGVFVTHRVDGRQIPVWVGNYVSMDYGTGAVMGVPAYDQRDMDFAKKHQIDILENSLDQSLSRYGTPARFYHLRDWLVSRQRYWGAPIPMIYCKKCGWNPVPAQDLPILLPTDVDFKPTGESPIARSKTFQKDVVCPVCGKKAQREVDTMDTFVDSSWYFLRFCDPFNSKEAFSKEMIKKWGPVDLYIGGAEHTVLHLMYARFFYKAFCDLKLIDDNEVQEPFLKLRHQGMVLGPDNRKMSKRWGNVVGLDEVIPKFGADTVRMYELFMGPFEDLKSWQVSGVEGIYRFLHRVFRKFNEGYISHNIDKLVAQVTKDIESMSFNTAISSMMKALNEMEAPSSKSQTQKEFQTTWDKFIRVLAPFSPYLAEEMWNIMGHTTSVHLEDWPEFKDIISDKEVVTMVVQIDGKVRGRLQTDFKIAKDEALVKQMAIESDKTGSLKKMPKYRTIFVPGRIINFVSEK